MAEALGVLGAAVGVTSLVVQVADECLKAYKYYYEAVNMAEDYAYLRLRLQIEQQRFLNFCFESGLLYTECTMSTNLQMHSPLVLAVLAELKDLFATFAKKYGKYEEIPRQDRSPSRTDMVDLMGLLDARKSPVLQDTITGHQKHKIPRKAITGLLQLGRNLRTIMTEPKRLVWVGIDKESFEHFIAKVKELNSYLIASLDRSQVKMLQEAMNASYLEILQLRNDMKSLAGLIQAISPDRDNSTSLDNETLPIHMRAFSSALRDEARVEGMSQAYFGRLAQVKMQYTSILEITSMENLKADDVSTTNMKLDLRDLEFVEPTEQGSFDRPRRRTSARYQTRDAWIEWKDIPDNLRGSRETRVQQTELRLHLLSDLLHFEKPPRFCSPPCLGYIMTSTSADNRSEPGFGLVFQKPEGTSSENSQMATLRHLFQTLDKPSLSARCALSAALARCTHSFHAVNWMHKGLRSDNVLFFLPPQSITPTGSNERYSEYETFVYQTSLRSPIVTGFELSRPENMDYISEAPNFDPAEDIYRHPAAQSFCRKWQGPYRKAHDMYSLGLILLEIAFWKPIEQLIGYEDCSILSRPMLEAVKDIVLGTAVHQAARAQHKVTAAPDSSPSQSIWSSLFSPGHTPAARSVVDRVSAECGDVLQTVVETCLRADEVEAASGLNAAAPNSAKLHRILELEVVRRLENLSAALQL